WVACSIAESAFSPAFSELPSQAASASMAAAPAANISFFISVILSLADLQSAEANQAGSSGFQMSPHFAVVWNRARFTTFATGGRWRWLRLWIPQLIFLSVSRLAWR